MRYSDNMPLPHERQIIHALLKMGSSIGTTNVETKPSDSVEMTPKGVNHKQSVHC